MPRIFKSELDLEIPKDVNFKIEGKKITVEGNKGKLTKDFSHMKGIELAYDKNKFNLTAYFPRKAVISKMGTLKSIVQNMVTGVTQGYTYKMKIAYSHFPITVEVQGEQILIKNFIGERSPRITRKAGDNIDVKATKEDVIINGIDKEIVGQTAANIQKRCRIRKKDKRVFQDGIYIYEKYAGDEPIWKMKV
jgi:large subunit ribosomal protein L6